MDMFLTSEALGYDNMWIRFPQFSMQVHQEFLTKYGVALPESLKSVLSVSNGGVLARANYRDKYEFDCLFGCWVEAPALNIVRLDEEIQKRGGISSVNLHKRVKQNYLISSNGYLHLCLEYSEKGHEEPAVTVFSFIHEEFDILCENFNTYFSSLQ